MRNALICLTMGFILISACAQSPSAPPQSPTLPLGPSATHKPPLPTQQPTSEPVAPPPPLPTQQSTSEPVAPPPPLPTQQPTSEPVAPPQNWDFNPDPIQLKEPGLAEGDQPVFIFLFTHTEDHINHELSEERYHRLAPEVARLAIQNPDAHLVWTIELMGADAKSVAERDPSTGVVKLLKDFAAQGYIEFGYHAQHEPTYLNRPQNFLTPDSTWEEVVHAIETFVTCEKYPVQGGCVTDDGGGLLAIKGGFGDVQMVTGLSLAPGIFITGGSVRHALVRYLPTFMVSFGFSDHAPTDNPQVYSKAVEDLMALLTPTEANSPGIFWMDDAIRINDSGAINTLGPLSLREGPKTIRKVIENVDRSRPQVMNASFASKYLYTAKGESPTKWAYAHPDSPELGPDQLNPDFRKNRLYASTIDALEYLVIEFMPQNPGSRFISSHDLVDLVAPKAYWELTAVELDAISRWLLTRWTNRPPDFASDGLDFYSLRDAMGLLAVALNGYQGEGVLPPKQQLTFMYGPLDDAGPSQETRLTDADVYAIAETISQGMISPVDMWQTTPSNILPPVFQTSGGRINTAQALYAMAMLYASTYAGTPMASISVPVTELTPETVLILDKLGCWTCIDSAWSLKPAKIHLSFGY